MTVTKKHIEELRKISSLIGDLPSTVTTFHDAELAEAKMRVDTLLEELEEMRQEEVARIGAYKKKGAQE